MTSLKSIQSEIRNQLPFSNLVITAPTGWGKSTEIPRSFLESHHVLMIEPRRIATKALAHRIADLEQEPVGHRIGYSVRGESSISPQTKLRIVTPGVAIRLFQSSQFQEYDIIIFDEIHERTLEQDLLLALCIHTNKRVLLLSATIAAQSIAQKVHGKHISVEGRNHPITLLYEHEKGIPRMDQMGVRIKSALRMANWNKDALVFLPGKGEINTVCHYLQTNLSSYEICTLHGGQTLKEQSKVFTPSNKRRIILSTNVAETALTIPNIDLVIDSGLERRTCYHQGRSFLALFPIAKDSAEQRKGRAGRLGPGNCVRLWGSTEKLLPQTPPQIFREALEPILLGAAICANTDIFRLPFLDPPTRYAVDDAQEYLRSIGAFDSQNTPTELGQQLFQLPIDHALGRLLIEAKHSGLLKSVIPLCAALSVRGGIFKNPPKDDDDEDIRKEHCDLQGLIRAMLAPYPKQVHKQAYQDGRATMKRLQELWKIDTCEYPNRLSDIAQCIIQAWPNSVHIRRKRGKRWAWSNGGTEKEKGSNCGVQEEKAEAIIVLGTFSQGRMARERTSWIEYAMPVPIPWLAKAGLGRPKLHRIHIQNGMPMAEIHQIYAGKNIETTEEPPPKEILTQALTELFTRGSWEKEWLPEAKNRHRIHSIACMLRNDPPVMNFIDYIAERIDSFELESAEDVSLLTGEDLLPPQELLYMRDKIEKDYPKSFSIGDAGYEISYDVPRKVMRFIQTKGTRKTAPSLSMCPRKAGWKYIWVYKNREFPL